MTGTTIVLSSWPNVRPYEERGEPVIGFPGAPNGVRPLLINFCWEVGSEVNPTQGAMGMFRTLPGYQVTVKESDPLTQTRERALVPEYLGILLASKQARQREA